MKVRLALLVATNCITTMMVCASAHAQNRDSEFFSNFSPAAVAEAAILNADPIAIGQFGSPVEIGTDSVSLLESREVDLDLTVLTVYKGSVRSGAVVKIRLRNDMLVYPGDTVSRYEKRIQLLEERAKELGAAAEERAAVQEALDRGDITTVEAEQRFSRSDARDEESIGETAELRRIRRQPIISHGETVYERDIAIRPNTPYLVAVGSIDGNPTYYALQEFNSGIWWGDAIDDIRSGIERLQETWSRSRRRRFARRAVDPAAPRSAKVP